MLEIDVYFGLNDTTDSTDVIVQPDPAALHSGDDIFWHFHSLDKTVEYARIEFDDKTVDFFDERGNTKTYKRKTKIEKANPAKGGHGHIVGTAPSNGGGTQANKYTVVAYDGDPEDPHHPGGVRYSYDPTVITCDP